MGKLLQSAELAERFPSGSAVLVFRLSPQDYHRFHSPVSGTLGPTLREVPGSYFTVNPVAVRENIDVFGENKRVVAWLDCEDPSLGRVAFVAVGATCVGSIVFTAHPGQRVAKGEELGYFAFGGSTVVCLFEPGRLRVDQDLLQSSAAGVETYVQMGYGVGRPAGGPMSPTAVVGMVCVGIRFSYFTFLRCFRCRP